MSEIELKERKPTWDYMLNDLAFSSLKTRVLYGIFDNQDRFDFEYQIELKDKEIERLYNIINELENELDRGYLDLFEYELVNGRELITNIKNYIQELKGSE